MDVTLKVTFLFCVVLNCNGASLREQLANIARRFNMHEGSVILGSPSYPNHLPEAEPILPGHTLIRPALGMLKSAVKFPHRELENGAGVYGNINNLGLRYDSRNERLMYSGFRRTDTPSTDFIMLIPESDSSIDEEISQLRQSPWNRNTVRKIKIFPAKLYNKKPSNWHDQRQPLILKLPTTLPKDTSKRRKKKLIIEADFTDDEPVKSEPRSPYDDRDDKIKIARSVASRLHSHANTLSFTKKLLDKIRSSQKRRLQDNNIIQLNLQSPIVYTGGGLEQRFRGMDSTDAEKLNQRKLQRLHGKHAFNYIEINADAPEHEDYLPADFEKGNNYDLKNWWYFHQSDFIPFEEKED